MIQHLKTRIWDWFLCICLSTGIVWSLFSGFLLEDFLFHNLPLVVLILAAILFLLEVISYKRTWIRAGLVVLGLGLVAYLVYIRLNNVWADESAHSLGITCTLIVGSGIYVYLTSRTRAGIILLFVSGNLVLCGAHFLQFPVQVWNFLLFTGVIFLMYLYRVYMITLMSVYTGKVRVGQFMRQALFLCGVSFLLGLGVYLAVIRPLNPPVQDLFLITKLENMDIMKVLGVSSVRELLDPNMISNMQSDQLDYTNQLENPEEESQSEEESTEEETQDQDPSSAVQYKISRFRVPWLLIFLAALVVALVIWFRQRNKRWQRTLAAMSPEDQVMNYYHYFLKKFARAGLKKPEQYTLYEYADNLEYEMELFITDGNRFLDLTDIYVETVYGNHKVTEAELYAYIRFYEEFKKNMIREVGRFTYLRKFLWV